mgnify:CR=1 FL=1
MAEESGVKWLGFGPASGWGEIYVGSGGPAWAGSDVAGVTGAPRRPHIYLPHIWAGYGGCWSAWAFEAHLRRPSGSKKCDQSVTGRPAQAYEADLRCPAVDALTNFFFNFKVLFIAR